MKIKNNRLPEYLSSHHIYWIGARASDAERFEHCLSGIICLYGRNSNSGLSIYSYEETSGIRSDNNTICSEANDYFRKTVRGLCESDPDSVFMFYNPGWIQDIGGLDDLQPRFICINDKSLTASCNSKIVSFIKYSDKIKMLPAKLLPASQCTYEELGRVFGESPFGYIIQAEYASGGCFTGIIDSNTTKPPFPLTDAEYLVSVYYKYSTSVNVHAIIYDNETVILPGSVQILRRENDHLIYRGADFIAYQKIDRASRNDFETEASKLCDDLRLSGYRGVIGIDGIIYNGTVAVVEINPRFQGSTAALNEGLFKNGKKTVQEYHMEAFFSAAPSDREISETQINVSTYSYSDIYPREHSEMILHQAAAEPHVIRIDKDGLDVSHSSTEDVYRFRLFFDTNISFNNFGEEVWIHENVCEPSPFIFDRILEGDPLALKITLMTIGVRIEESTRRYLVQNGGIREGNNNSIDVLIRKMVINAPTEVRFIAFTPYEIRLENDGRLSLYYYDHYLDDISIWKTDPLCSKVTKGGYAYADIAYLSTDRLRVHMTNKCIFKKCNKSCKFCNINTDSNGSLIPLEDIKEVVSAYLELPEVRHLLVGGQSADEHAGKTRVVEIIHMIRELTDKDIYVMTLPFSKETILKMKNVGMTELACNIEVFDSDLAFKYMPGKGSIKREYYYDILAYAAKLYPGKKDVVRSAFIIGLEPHDSMMRGIKKLLDAGCQPILSVFRPLPDTDLEDYMMPPCRYLYDLYAECDELCRRYDSYLGPSCVNCQNNTLSLPVN